MQEGYMYYVLLSGVTTVIENELAYQAGYKCMVILWIRVNCTLKVVT